MKTELEDTSRSRWQTIIAKTIFLSPDIVEMFQAQFGDTVVMPLAVRATVSSFPEAGGKTNGVPIRDGENWYALWGMRPSRDVCSIAVGLKRRELEDFPLTAIKCVDGSLITHQWRVHHIDECRESHCSTAERASRFTDLSNLVLISADMHDLDHQFVHGKGLGAEWLKYVAKSLYANTTRWKAHGATRPPSSPAFDLARLAAFDRKSFEQLAELRKSEPAGTSLSTERVRIARESGQTFKPIDELRSSSNALKRIVKQNLNANIPPSEKVTPNILVKELKAIGYLSRQNARQSSLYLNLGGSQSEIRSVSFRGAILLFPSRNIVFGIPPDDMYAFRTVVMSKISDLSTRKDVKGPSALNRVAVTLLDDRFNEKRLLYEGITRIWIEGLVGELECVSGFYNRKDVEEFLERFRAFGERT